MDKSAALKCVSGRVRDQRRAQLICEYARLVVFADVWLSLCVAVERETSDERRAAIPSGAPGMVPEWVRYVRGGEAWTTKAERAEVT